MPPGHDEGGTAMSDMKQAPPVPLVVHLIYRLDIGGLETLLVDASTACRRTYRHAVVCLTDYTEFAQRITRPASNCTRWTSRPASAGHAPALVQAAAPPAPAVLHTYNLGTIEYHFTALLAGVPVRVHAEHGRDASDPHG
jgi:hypothetical protein